MKKKKLNLQELKVNSFITSVNKENSKTVKGGLNFTCDAACGPASNNCTDGTGGITDGFDCTAPDVFTKKDDDITQGETCRTGNVFRV